MTDGDRAVGHGAAAARELVDVIDEAGNVIGTATRAEVRAQNLWHRSVFIVVVTSADELVVHQRADWKDIWPSRWDVGFGGVVDAGEGFDDAAVRELAEEAGVTIAPADLVPLVEAIYEDDLVRERGRVYLARADGPFTFADGEVTEARWVTFDELDSMRSTHRFLPDSMALLLPLLAPH